MPITELQLAAAKTLQNAAAHDPAPQVRLIAGPGSGKSFAIGERVLHLLGNGIDPAEIAVVSFTRAAARDLGFRISRYCHSAGHPEGSQVSVSTLHSLALRMLRKANLLTHYPTNPLVLDTWEVENVYDAEFGEFAGIRSKDRRRDIRAHHEAFWSTGQWGPPNYIPPDPPITEDEGKAFQVYHAGRSQLYACVLPGEIVRQAVQQIEAGVLDPVELLKIKHLIVDEFQDLNRMDLQLVDQLIGGGVLAFATGDDDQSIYSFRFAAPSGIQEFAKKYGTCSQHVLQHCFRCTPNVLAPAVSLIEAHAASGRIPKNLASVYSESAPPVAGVAHRWRFKSGNAEAAAIAASCRSLIDAGVDPSDIMILLSNTRLQSKPICDALDTEKVEYEPPSAEGFLDSEVGRSSHAIVRISCDRDDYVAHRVLVGTLRGVGIGTCRTIADQILANNLNYRDVFYSGAPTGLFSGRATSAHERARSVCASAAKWDITSVLSVERRAEIAALLEQTRSKEESKEFLAYVAPLPEGMNLGELRDFMWAENPGQQARLLEAVYTRLGLPVPEEAIVPSRVRVMTMHSAKGLDAQVAIIPGLEDAILPGPRRAPYPGLVQEAARLLYVSVTRARAACILTFAVTRMVYGKFDKRVASRFCAHLVGPFTYRESGLSADEVSEITESMAQL